MSDAPEPRARPPKPVTRDWLVRAAAHYLERYATSSGNLRRVLGRKVMRRAAARGEDAAAFGSLVDAVVAHFLDLKLLDDRAFAESRVASLRRRGTSRRGTAAKLAAKGLDGETVEAALAGDETDEATAARAYVRRRRLGPFRLRERAERRDRDVAAMMRAGFSYRDAAEAIDGVREEEG